MPFIPVPNVVMCEIRATLDAQQIENTMYFEFNTVPTAADVQTIADTMNNWWGQNILPHLSQDYTMREVYATDLTEQTGPTATATGFLPAGGGDVVESESNNNALCVSFRTAARGRTGRGRNYISGIPTNQVTNNTVSQTFVDQIVGAYNGLQAGLDAIGWTWVVVSRHFNGVDRAVGVARPVTAAIVVDRVIDSQRRRLPGRGT